MAHCGWDRSPFGTRCVHHTSVLEAVVAETVAVPSRPSANQLRVTAEVNVYVAQRVAVTIVATAAATAAVTAALQPRMTAYHQWP